MVYKVPFLLNGSWWEIGLIFLLSFVAVAMVAVAIIGYFKGPLHWALRLLLFFAAGLLLFGNIPVQLVGLIVTGAIVFINWRDNTAVEATI